MWGQADARELVAAGVRVARSWDLAAVHRLLHGGWQADPATVWAAAHGLELAGIPQLAPVDLFHPAPETPPDPVGPDGHLSPEWCQPGFVDTPERRAAWQELAEETAALQFAAVEAAGGLAVSTAYAESSTELLCAELAADGLPIDRGVARALVDDAVERARDHHVLRHVAGADDVDLRSPGQVKSLLRRVGIEVPDTRRWTLEPLRDAHPLVDALLRWRRAERIVTTYGHDWLDAHVGDDGRLRGEWTGSDGAAGRMTASAGLHNLPAEMRRAVVAEPGHVFVRADLGQIEPRVLAAVSGDRALATATATDDMYAEIATALGVERATAKVAVLGAMYGQTTGHGAAAMARLRTSYPVAVGYLDAAAAAAQGGNDLRTYGGRLIRMGVANSNDTPEAELRRHAAARGRYGRNALVQGAAAELFKRWALGVRAGLDGDSFIALCLHDELLVHTPAERAAEVTALVHRCLTDAAARWVPPGLRVRFVADVSTVRSWADAKD